MISHFVFPTFFFAAYGMQCFYDIDRIYYMMLH